MYVMHLLCWQCWLMVKVGVKTPGPATDLLCDYRQVTFLLAVSVFTAMKGE